jgi:hypothetical protein
MFSGSQSRRPLSALWDTRRPEALKTLAAWTKDGAKVERMHEVRGDTVGAFEVARMRSIIVAVVATVAIIGPAQALDLAAKRVAPEIGSAGYSIAAEERRHAAYPRRR